MGRRKTRRNNLDQPDQIPNWSNEKERLVSELSFIKESPIPWIAAIPRMVEELELTRKEICTILNQLTEMQQEAEEGSDLRYHSEWGARVHVLTKVEDPFDPFSACEEVFDPVQARQMADIVRQMIRKDQERSRQKARDVLEFPNGQI